VGTRTVSVDLQLKAAGFVAGAKEAEKATNALNDELDGVARHGKDFDKAVAETDKLTVAMKETSHEVDATGKQMKETAVDAQLLADKLAKARDKALELATAFSLTGDKTDLSKYKKQASYVSDLERLLKLNTPEVANPLAKDASKLGSSAGQDFGDAFKAAGPVEAIGNLFADPIIGVPLLATAAVVGAEVGGVIGGAIVTGIGLAGIGAGVAAAFTDPRVKAAASGAFSGVLSGIVSDARDAFAAPTVVGLTEVAGAFEALRPKLRGFETELAPLTAELGHGIAEGVDKFGDHLTKALVNSKPLIEWAANEIPQVLDEVGGLLENLSEHADEERFALNTFFGAVEIGIKILEGLADAGSAVISPFQKIHDLVFPRGGTVPGAAVAFDAVSQSVTKLGYAAIYPTTSLSDLEKQLKATTVSADSLAGAMVDKVFGALMDADAAALHLAEAHTRLSESFKQNGKSIDINTAAGQANREMVRAVIQQNIENYDWMIKSGQGADAAAAAYDQNTAALEKQLHKLGLAPAAIDELVGKYRQVPGKVDTDIAMNGLTDAINDLDDLIRMLNGLPPRKTITITTKVTTGVGHGVAGARALGGQLPHAAEGAFFGPSDPGILIAEPSTHGEWLIPQAGISQQRAYDLGSAAMAPHGLAVSRPAMVSSGGGPSTLQLAATFVLPSGETVHKQLITYALNTGRQPAQLFPAVSR